VDVPNSRLKGKEVAMAGDGDGSTDARSAAVAAGVPVAAPKSVGCSLLPCNSVLMSSVGVGAGVLDCAAGVTAVASPLAMVEVAVGRTDTGVPVGAGAWIVDRAAGRTVANLGVTAVVSSPLAILGAAVGLADIGALAGVGDTPVCALEVAAFVSSPAGAAVGKATTTPLACRLGSTVADRGSREGNRPKMSATRKINRLPMKGILAPERPVFTGCRSFLNSFSRSGSARSRLRDLFSLGIPIVDAKCA
jgi:hypothetical protein